MSTQVSSATTHYFLLEIGTEELPPGFLQQASAQLCDAISLWLGDKLPDASQNGSITLTPYATPRRLAVLLSGLPAVQPELTITHKGPPLKVAKDAQGNWTKAAEAFAKKMGVSVDALSISHQDGQETLFHTQQQSGQALTTLLTNAVPQWLAALQGPRFMRWGAGTQGSDGDCPRFPRPIRWLTVLWDDTPLSLTLAPESPDAIASGHTTRGHRLLGEPLVSLSHAKTYAQTLADKAQVIASWDERRALIAQQLDAAATSLGGTVLVDADLLDLVTALVEKPSVLVGTIPAHAMTLPKAVITTVMTVHQKYFAVVSPTGELLPSFLVVTNANPMHHDTIRAGNERVLNARLADALFFWETDLKKSLDVHAEKLAGMTFQQGLGTMADKAQRLATVAELVGKAAKLSSAEQTDLQQAARWAKADLGAQMVFEFTELQGEIGGIYAREQGANPAVVTAISEQYFPRFQGDRLPEHPVSAALNLADKLDTLMAVFSYEGTKLPSGSKDPLALRRQVNGILQLMRAQNWGWNLMPMLVEAYTTAAATPKHTVLSFEATWERLHPFIRTRLVSLIQQQLPELAPDSLDAVLATRPESVNPTEPNAYSGVLANLPSLWAQLEAFHNYRNGAANNFEALYTPALRIARILSADAAADAATTVKPASFQDASEATLWEALQALPAVTGAFPLTQADFQAEADALTALAQPIAAFFEVVMVNDPDPTIRANRRALLTLVHQRYARLADWQRVVSPAALAS